MKRFFCLLLVLLFLPLVSFADNNPFVGVWIYHAPSSMNSRKIIVYQIDEHNNVYYSSQVFYLDGSPASIESAVYSCEYSGNCVIIKSGDSVIKELYRVSDYCLSSDKSKTYGFYYLSIEKQETYKAITAPDPNPVPVVSSDPVNNDPCGKWSFYYDIREWPKSLLDVIDNPVQSFELYLFPDGSANFTEMTINKKGKVDFSYGALSGVWLGDGDNLVIRVGSSTYKATMVDGSLHLHFTEKISLPFVRIDQTDLFHDQVFN